MRILLIEDNPGDARLVQEMLKETSLDYRINIKEKLGPGLEFVKHHEVDVVLLDLGLPDSQGLETLNRLHVQFKHLPIVIMTSSDDELLGVQAVNQGAQDYLVKGQVGSKFLERSLLYAVERKKTEKALARARKELEVLVEERTRELVQANKQLKQYARKIVQVQEEERKRIAYELHDDTAQYLSILKLELESLLHSGKIQSPEILEKLAYLEKDASRAVNDVRRFSHELRPSILEHLGLQAALEQISEDINNLQQITVEVNIEGTELEIPEEVKLGFFRIAQEALNNVRKHAQASKATISLKFEDDAMEMMIRDNGAGFDIEAARTRSTLKGSLGLMSMQERAQLIGADLKIESQTGQGTAIRVRLPLDLSQIVS